MVSPFGDEIREFQVVMPHWDFTSRPAGWVGWWGRGMTWQYTANRFSPTLWSYFEQIMLTAFQFSFFIKLQKVHGSSCRPGAQRPDIYGNTRMKHIESHRMMTVVEGGTPSTGFHLQGENLEDKKFWRVPLHLMPGHWSCEAQSSFCFCDCSPGTPSYSLRLPKSQHFTQYVQIHTFITKFA